MLDYFKDCTAKVPSAENPNFIVNPKALVDAFWVSDLLRSEYLGICSLRSYNDYTMYGDVDLSLDLIPDYVPLEIIKQNPLIKLTETKIKLIKENI
jgi:hypothetical protein